MWGTVPILLLVALLQLAGTAAAKHKTYDSAAMDKPFRVDDEDGYLSVPQLVWKYGYYVEVHEVRTEDGYLLDMYRIRGKRNEAPPGQRNAPVFLMHSLLSTSADWVMMGPDHALGYQLADRGYDVWMGNARGTRYSRKHAYLDPKSYDFWQFSWHEIGFYDVPALVDYALGVSGYSRLHYVGFSQGTMVFFVMMSMRPEYNAKIIHMQALAPSVYMYRITGSLVRLMLNLQNQLAQGLRSINRYDFLPHTPKLYALANVLCRKRQETICRSVIYDVGGRNPAQLDNKMQRIILGHIPAGASVKQLQHFGQIIQTTRFAQYSYGRKVNQQLYGTADSPLYNISRATVPVIVYYGLNDHVVNYQDARRLAAEVSNLYAVHPVSDRHFTHFDFVVAKNAARVVYHDVLRHLDDFDASVPHS